MHSLFSLMMIGTLFRATSLPSSDVAEPVAPVSAYETFNQDADTEIFLSIRGKTLDRRTGAAAGLERPSSRERLGGDMLRCIQIGRQTRKSPGPNCERMEEYVQLLKNCGADMNVSTYCMPMEQQVVDWAAEHGSATYHIEDAE